MEPPEWHYPVREAPAVLYPPGKAAGRLCSARLEINRAAARCSLLKRSKFNRSHEADWVKRIQRSVEAFAQVAQYQ
jgi:hypothetical protein